MPRLLRPALLAFITATASVNAATLDTPSFLIQITPHCAAGNTTCDNVSYRGTSKKRGNAIALHGKTVHALCADGQSPCRFLGYEFFNGKVRYFVSEDGRLTVARESQLLVTEKGRWRR